MEVIYSQNAAKWLKLNFNLLGYQNTISPFTVVNKYPAESIYSAQRQQIFSGNIKLNGQFYLATKWEGQLSAVYQAPDLVPQGKTFARFSIDLGIKRNIQKGRGELFANASDIANTLNLKKEVQGNGFRYTSTDYYETQVIRVGYSYKF